MPEENTTNLPILDDVIKTGQPDAAVNRSSKRPPPTVWPKGRATDKHTAQPESAPKPPADKDAADASANAPTGQQPDIEAITEAILASLRDEIESLLRQKIRQALQQHFPTGRGSS